MEVDGGRTNEMPFWNAWHVMHRAVYQLREIKQLKAKMCWFSLRDYVMWLNLFNCRWHKKEAFYRKGPPNTLKQEKKRQELRVKDIPQKGSFPFWFRSLKAKLKQNRHTQPCKTNEFCHPHRRLPFCQRPRGCGHDELWHSLIPLELQYSR